MKRKIICMGIISLLLMAGFVGIASANEYYIGVANKLTPDKTHLLQFSVTSIKGIAINVKTFKITPCNSQDITLIIFGGGTSVGNLRLMASWYLNKTINFPIIIDGKFVE
jgi:hypothetical protein